MALVLDGTNGVSGVDGTASNPAIEGTDSNTGIFYPAADTVAIGTGGTEALRVNSSQNVGINTISPGGKFNVDFGNFAGVGARFQYNSSNTPFCINALNSNGAAYIAWNAAAKSSSDTATRVLAQAATKIEGGSGLFIFYNTASSTAGSDITWSERMRLDASGNLGVGTASPSQRFDAQVATGTEGSGLAVSNSEAGGYGSGVSFYSYRTDGTTKLMAGQVSMLGAASWSSATFTSSHMLFKTVNENTLAERARITSGGDLLLGTTSTGFNNRIGMHYTGDTWGVMAINTSSSGNVNGIRSQYNAQAPNNTGSYFFFADDNAATRFYVRSNGGISNYTGNNVGLSDRREKTNFAPAKNYLDIICAIPVQTFNYIDQNMEEDPGLTLGVIAQDVQEVAPEFVHESDWGTPDNPKMRLGVYEADMMFALMKSIQELKAIVDAQAAEIAALKGNA